jgi:hypothetical protein
MLKPEAQREWASFCTCMLTSSIGDAVSSSMPQLFSQS